MRARVFFVSNLVFHIDIDLSPLVEQYSDDLDVTSSGCYGESQAALLRNRGDIPIPRSINKRTHTRVRAAARSTLQRQPNLNERSLEPWGKYHKPIHKDDYLHMRSIYYWSVAYMPAL